MGTHRRHFLFQACLPGKIRNPSDDKQNLSSFHSNTEFFQYKCIKHIYAAAATAKLLQSCLTLCDPTDSSPPGCPIPGILQERTLEWVAISFSNAGKWKVKVKSLSRVRLFVIPWTAAHQAPPSMGFSRQEYWSEAPSPSPQLKSINVNDNVK